jgi:Protein of unknown function (DUF3072)
MTLGNMRANGVRTLAAWCLGRCTFSWNKTPTARLYCEHDPLKTRSMPLDPNSRRPPQPTTADGPMTAEQAARLNSLARAAYELDAFKPHLTRTEAEIRIAMLTAKLKLLDGPPHTL